VGEVGYPARTWIIEDCSFILDEGFSLFDRGMLKRLLSGRFPFGAKLVGFSGWLPRLQRHIHELSGEKMHTIQIPPLFF